MRTSGGRPHCKPFGWCASALQIGPGAQGDGADRPVEIVTDHCGWHARSRVLDSSVERRRRMTLSAWPCRGSGAGAARESRNHGRAANRGARPSRGARLGAQPWFRCPRGTSVACGSRTASWRGSSGEPWDPSRTSHAPTPGSTPWHPRSRFARSVQTCPGFEGRGRSPGRPEKRREPGPAFQKSRPSPLGAMPREAARSGGLERSHG